MSEDTGNKAAPSGEGDKGASSELGNFKAEMNRKLSNLESANAQLLAQLSALVKPKEKEVSTSEDKVPSVFDDEAKFAEAVVQRAEKRVTERLSKQSDVQAKQQAIINKLYQEFPEVNDEQSELMVRAKAIYSEYPESERNTPFALRAAVTEAASELGVKPKSKRSAATAEDGFSMGSGRSSPRPTKSGDITPETDLFAQLIQQATGKDGPDFSKAEVRERLKARAKAQSERKGWF